MDDSPITPEPTPDGPGNNGKSEKPGTGGEPEPRPSPHFVSWIIGYLIAACAMASVLIALRVLPLLAAAWWLLALSVLVICESDGFSEILSWNQSHPKGERLDLLAHLENDPPARKLKRRRLSGETAGSSPEKISAPLPLERYWKRRLVESLISLALAALAALSSPLVLLPAPQRESVPPELTQRLDQIERSVNKCLDKACTVPNTANNGNSTIHLDPQVESALLDYLKHAMMSSGSGPTASMIWPLWIIIVLLLAIAIALFIPLFKERPEAAPPLGATGLAGAVIAKTHAFSHFDLYQEWALGALLAFAVVVLIGGVILYFFVKPAQAVAAGAHTQEDSKLKAFSTLSLNLFSVFVLIWVVVLVCFGPAEPKPVKTEPTPPPGHSELMIDRDLPSIAGFLPGKTSLFPNTKPGSMPDDSRDNLMTRLKQDSASRGDILMLLGSADCVRGGHSDPNGNRGLATRRAQWVQSQLQLDAQALGLILLAKPMATHESCEQAPEMRAVYPVLIRLKADAS